VARNSKPRGPTPVESITHGDKRANIPTADAHDFVDPQIEEVRQVRYERDESLDPQLVWRQKYDDHQAGSDLVTDAPPIYIQEKIDPRVLIENLRRTAVAKEDEPELTLFESFDGLDELDLVDFYQHQANWSNRMILGDSLQVMASLAEREQLRGKVQMVYLDPPYGIKFGSNWQVSARKRDVKDGKLEDAAREAEQIKAFRDTWELGIHSYLTYLRDRLLVARDLLTESGSVFVQIGDENVHLVRSLMDEVFGSENFCSLISFRTTSGAGSFAGGTNVLASTNDYIVWYAFDLQSIKYRQLFRAKELGGAGAGQYTWAEAEDGLRRSLGHVSQGTPSDRIFQPTAMTSQTTRVGQTTVFPIEVEGRVYNPSKGGWKTNRDGMKRLVDARRLMGIGQTLRYVRYLDDFPAFPYTNSWEDTVTSGFSDPKTYVVQTHTRVIERCMLMCTDPGDLVLDPTCGSGTTAYVAEQWGRRWITIDTSRVALALARQRVMGAKFPYYLLADSTDGRAKEQALTAKPLPQGVVTDDIRHGFVYERVQHITLKSIANNPDIKEGMSREEVDAAIKRHATSRCSTTSRTRTSGRCVLQARSRSSRCRRTGPLLSRGWSRTSTGRRSPSRTPAPPPRAQASSSPSSTTLPRRASRTADATSGSRSPPWRPTPAPTSRRSASVPTRFNRVSPAMASRRHRRGWRSRSARSTGRSARRTSRAPPARRSVPRTSTCCASSGSRSTRRSPASPRRTE
jgi:adenine-specific DNA-methyltransferase